MNNSRNPKTLSFILEGTLKDWRGIFLIDKCLSDTFKIHYNKILGASNTDQHSYKSTTLLYWENVIELLMFIFPFDLLHVKFDKMYAFEWNEMQRRFNESTYKQPSDALSVRSISLMIEQNCYKWIKWMNGVLYNIPITKWKYTLLFLFIIIILL